MGAWIILWLAAIAGADKQWRWAEARIDGDSVVCSHPDVREPAAIRYAFSSNSRSLSRDASPLA